MWSPGFQFTAYLSITDPSRVVVERADGTRVAYPHFDGAKAVLALSPDGRYVALGDRLPAGARASSWREILDTQTDTIVLNLDHPAGPKPGRFPADGTFILHDRDKIKHVRVDGTVIATL